MKISTNPTHLGIKEVQGLKEMSYNLPISALYLIINLHGDLSSAFLSPKLSASGTLYSGINAN